MQWTASDIILALGLVSTFLGLWLTARKGTNERDKLEAETAVLYADMNNAQAKRITGLVAEITALRSELSVKSESLNRLDNEIVELRALLDQRNNRIFELEELSRKQESEITALRQELELLKSKRGK